MVCFRATRRLFLPTRSSRLSGDFLAFCAGQLLGPDKPPPATKLSGGALGRCLFLNLPRRDPGHHNGGTDYIGWALLALGSLGHLAVNSEGAEAYG